MSEGKPAESASDPEPTTSPDRSHFRAEVADDRDQIAAERDHIADLREEVAERRERAADAREMRDDTRAELAQDRELRTDQIVRAISVVTATSEERGMEAIDRARARLAESAAMLERSEAMITRSRALVDRSKAEIDREIALTEREHNEDRSAPNSRASLTAGDANVGREAFRVSP